MSTLFMVFSAMYTICILESPSLRRTDKLSYLNAIGWRGLLPVEWSFSPTLQDHQLHLHISWQELHVEKWWGLASGAHTYYK